MCNLKTQGNRNRVGYRKQTFGEGNEIDAGDQEIQTSCYKSWPITYSTGNTVTNILITLYGDRW